MAWGVFLTTGFDPCVAVAAINDVERHVLFVFGQIRIVVTAADQALDAKDSVFWVGDRLAFRWLADKALIVGESNDRRRCARAFGVFDYTRLAAIQLLVVPRSIPITLDMFRSLFESKAMTRDADPFWHPAPIC